MNLHSILRYKNSILDSDWNEKFFWSLIFYSGTTFLDSKLGSKVTFYNTRSKITRRWYFEVSFDPEKFFQTWGNN